MSATNRKRDWRNCEVNSPLQNLLKKSPLSNTSSSFSKFTSIFFYSVEFFQKLYFFSTAPKHNSSSNFNGTAVQIYYFEMNIFILNELIFVKSDN